MVTFLSPESFTSIFAVVKSSCKFRLPCLLHYVSFKPFVDPDVLFIEESTNKTEQPVYLKRPMLCVKCVQLCLCVSC